MNDNRLIRVVQIGRVNGMFQIEILTANNNWLTIFNPTESSYKRLLNTLSRMGASVALNNAVVYFTLPYKGYMES